MNILLYSLFKEKIPMLFDTVRRHEYNAIKGSIVALFYTRTKGVDPRGAGFSKNQPVGFEVEDGTVVYVRYSINDVLSRSDKGYGGATVLTYLMDTYLKESVGADETWHVSKVQFCSFL
jgi:hypothetical protein